MHNSNNQHQFKDRSYDALFKYHEQLTGAFQQPKQHNTLLMGHRGGFRPMNSLESFKKALDCGSVPIVELDVWLTSDDHLVIVHGGNSGEINFGSTKDVSIQSSYIFECTLEQNRSLETGFVLPTLREVFQLLNKKVFINIEIKVPDAEADRLRYNWRKAVRVIHELVQEYQLKDYCFVSSFDYAALKEMEIYSHSQLYSVKTIYLTNYFNHIEVPAFEEIIKMGDGLNVQYEHITRELVDYLHMHGKIICVWVDAEQTIECPEVYCKIYDLGIDSYCTDFPLKVQTVWRNYRKVLAKCQS